MIGTFVLCGFAGVEAYERRTPSWEPDTRFHEPRCRDSSGDVARLVTQSSAAQVEVIELVGNDGHVRRLVDQGGTEQIG